MNVQQKFSVKNDPPSFIKNLCVGTINMDKPQTTTPYSYNLIYNENGYLVFKGVNGTITVIANR